MSTQDFEQKLSGLADLILKVGLNLQPDQRLVILADLEAAPLVYEVSAQAYRDGCSVVTVFWRDEKLDLVRLQNAPKDAFEEFSHGAYDSIPACLERGDAYLQLAARTPDLLKDQDPNLVVKINRAKEQAYFPILSYQSLNQINWSVVYIPTTGWAKKVFPDLEPAVALDRLWLIVSRVCRLDEDDPTGVWQAHLRTLARRCDDLTQRQFRALHFLAPGTDLVVGLPQGHRWFGGQTQSQEGVPFVPNLPTEEIFTLPHREQVEGTVTATKPLNYQGYLIEDFALTFRAGRVIEVKAGKGEAILRSLVATDENAGRLGEVALVPHQSPISQTGMIFYNTLYDENAAHHIALGSAYKFTLSGGEEMSDDEFEKAGGNRSVVHVDFMIGSGETDVFGIDKRGESVKILDAGAWVEGLRL